MYCEQNASSNGMASVSASSSRMASVKCNLILQKCLAVQLLKRSTSKDCQQIYGNLKKGFEGSDYWMYENGYLLFQGFIEANSKCFWNISLIEAVKDLEFEGYVSHGILLISGTTCSLEVLRSAWSRNVLKAPTNYTINLVGDIEDCLITHVSEGQFTPLPEALCWVILELTSSGQHAVMNNIRNCLHSSFPDIEKPSSQVVYDTLAKLMEDNKVYQTHQGYFIVTPETIRHRFQKSNNSSPLLQHMKNYSDNREDSRMKPLLMTNEEAFTYVHGEISTIRDGDVTHQSIQTNLADVICGGNSSDKIMYASNFKCSIERRNSLKLFGANKKISILKRSGSMKFIPSKCNAGADSSPMLECLSSNAISRQITKKPSLLSRLFRRSPKKRVTRGSPAIHTFSAQFPPPEWFNPKVIHTHSIGTQTKVPEMVITTPLDDSSIKGFPLNQNKSKTALSKNCSREDQMPADILKLKPENANLDTSKTKLFVNANSSKSNCYNSKEKGRNQVSKSLKNLNKGFLHEIKVKSESSLYEETKNRRIHPLNVEDTNSKGENFFRMSGNVKSSYRRVDSLSSPGTRRKRRSTSLPRRKISTASFSKGDSHPVTHTHFPYNGLQDGKLESRDKYSLQKSTSYENVDNNQNSLINLSTKNEAYSKCFLNPVEKKHITSNTCFNLEDYSINSSGYETHAHSFASISEDLAPLSLNINSAPYTNVHLSENEQEYKSNELVNISLTTGATENSVHFKVSGVLNGTKYSRDKCFKKHRNDKVGLSVSSETDWYEPATTSTINDSETKILVLPIRSLITVENRCDTLPFVNLHPKLECLKFLYSPKEVLKTMHGFEHRNALQLMAEKTDEKMFNCVENSCSTKILCDFHVASIPNNHDEENKRYDIPYILNNSNVNRDSIKDNVRCIDTNKHNYGLCHDSTPNVFDFELSNVQDIPSTFQKEKNDSQNLSQYKNDLTNENLFYKESDLSSSKTKNNSFDFEKNGKINSILHQNDFKACQKLAEISMKPNQAKCLNRPVSIDNSQLISNKSIKNLECNSIQPIKTFELDKVPAAVNNSRKFDECSYESIISLESNDIPVEQNNIHELEEITIKLENNNSETNEIPTFPSLSELNVNFNSIAAKNILNNTLEVNSSDDLNQ